MVRVAVFFSAVAVANAGACSADDQAALSDVATVGAAGSKCGLKAFGIGGFDHDKFNTCFTGELGVSSGCSECYAVNGEYASKNCKAACLLGWCKQGCLDCSTAAEPKAALESCTGFASGSADPCLESEATCSGTDDFAETPACYGNNVMGQEDVTMKIESFASGAGRLSVTGTGATPLTCETAFTKDGSNKIAIEDCDVSAYATIKGAQYCSDTDELKATFNPLGVPIPVSVKFPRIACPGATAKKDIDCTTAACPDQCTCSLDKCADEIASCLAVPNCATSQDCALACPCSDTACMLKCAAKSPSIKALPAAKCINSQCTSSVAMKKDIDCTTAACPDQCSCSLDKCADEIASCLAVPNCATSQDCALACPCSDTACMLKCAAKSPSIKALPAAKCINSQCASSSVSV